MKRKRIFANSKNRMDICRTIYCDGVQAIWQIWIRHMNILKSYDLAKPSGTFLLNTHINALFNSTV
jgi:hypothetical protein